MKNSFRCQLFKMMGMSQPYTDEDFVYWTYHSATWTQILSSGHATSLHGRKFQSRGHVAALRRRQVMSGAPKCAPTSFQQCILAGIGIITITNFYVVIFIVPLKPNTWYTNCSKIENPNNDFKRFSRVYGKIFHILIPVYVAPL